jgi:hypothetical protein
MIQSTSDWRSDGGAVPWLAALAVAALGSWILYAAMPGINLLLWTLLAAAAFAASESAGRKPPAAARVVPLLLAIVLAGGAAVTTQSFVLGLILLSLVLLSAVLTLFTAGLAPAQLGPGALTLAPLLALAAGLAASASQLRRVLGLARAERSLPWLRGGMLAVTVGAAFFLLLSAADGTMAQWRDAAWEALVALSFLPRTIFFLVLAIGTLGGCTLAARPGKEHSAGRPATAVLRDVERLMVLGAVAAVFALFLLLQVSYLFGNPGARPGSGQSYAAAVHLGFGELTIAAALCLLLALGLDRHALRGVHERRVQGLTLALIAEAALLLVSAHLRVSAYEEAYGYSLERLYVHAHTVAVALALALLAFEVRTSIDAGRLFRRLGLAAALSVALFAYWNHSAWVARQNLARYQRSGQLDVSYLVQGLGEDALPEVIRDLPVLAAPQAQMARALLEPLRAASAKARTPRWYEWNLRRAAARAALASLPDNGAQP